MERCARSSERSTTEDEHSERGRRRERAARSPRERSPLCSTPRATGLNQKKFATPGLHEELPEIQEPHRIEVLGLAVRNPSPGDKFLREAKKPPEPPDA